jgi:hypothetical protein
MTTTLFRIHRIPEDEAPPEKKVHFALDDGNDRQCDNQEDSGAPPLWTTLTNETIDELWYQPAEIAAMKAEAKYHILHRGEATPDEVCGLDRFTSQRALWKRSAIQYVLISQRHNNGDEFIRRVSLRCSGWFREKACEQGFRDYCSVHDPLASLLDCDDVDNYNECFFSNEGCNGGDDGSSAAKRSALESNEGGAEEPACKRQRTMTVEDESVTDASATHDLDADNSIL